MASADASAARPRACARRTGFRLLLVQQIVQQELRNGLRHVRQTATNAKRLLNDKNDWQRRRSMPVLARSASYLMDEHAWSLVFTHKYYPKPQDGAKFTKVSE